MALRDVILKVFGWWDGPTIGTAVWTRRFGQRVGEDGMGNVFYRTADDSRRWVIYKGAAEASRVTPEWQAWLHKTWDKAPSEMPVPHKRWEKPYLPNLSGTDMAYVPRGSILRPDPVERRDYDAWTPE